MKNCLFITKHDPFGMGGGSYATNAYLKLFISLFPNLDLCMAEECIKETSLISKERLFGVKKRNIFEKILQTLFGVYHRFYNYVFNLDLDKYDVIVLDHSSVSSSFVRILNKKHILTVTIHHNVEKEYYLSNSKKIYKWIAAFFIQRNEKIAYKNSVLNLFLTEYDKNYFLRKYGLCKGTNFVSSFFFDETSFFFENTNCRKKYDFVISCTLSSIQNQNMVINFLSKYENMLKNYKILITGRNPSDELRKRVGNFSNITLIANPENIQNVISEAKIYLCPIENGGGIKVRCFDAISMLMPALVHENALRGYEVLKDKFFYSYSDINSFVKQTNVLLKQYDKILREKDKYKEIAIENFSLQHVQVVINDMLALKEEYK